MILSKMNIRNMREKFNVTFCFSSVKFLQLFIFESIIQRKFHLTGVPDIILGESKEESDGRQIFTFTIKSIPAPYNVQWQVSDNNSDMFTTLDENAEEYRGTSHSFPHPVLVVRLKELLKNNIYQIEVQNIVGGRRKKIPSMKCAYFKIVLKK